MLSEAEAIVRGFVDYGHDDGVMFCSDPNCLCHEDELLIYMMYVNVLDGLITPEEATELVKGNGK
jgi:hypothetical protein